VVSSVVLAQIAKGRWREQLREQRAAEWSAETSSEDPNDASGWFFHAARLGPQRRDVYAHM